MQTLSQASTGLSPYQLDLFRQAALILTSSLELDEALANAIEACLPAIGDFGFFDVILDDGVRRTARAYQSPELEAHLSKTSWTRQQRTDIKLCALSTGEAVVHTDTNDDWYAAAFEGAPRTLAFRSMLSVPLVHRGELIGSLTLFMASSGRNHTASDLDFAAELAGLAAPVVVNARLLAQQRRVEASTNAVEMRLQLALKVGGMGAWQWDMVKDKVTWWPGMAALHGLPEHTQLAKVHDYLQLVHPDDRSIAGRSLGGDVSPEVGVGKEYRIVWPNGIVRWLEGRGEVFWDEGKPVLMAGVCIDVTQRKITEQNLLFLASASSELAELVDHEETLSRVARLAVPTFADWCTVDLLDDDGAIKRVAVSHVNPEKVQLAHELYDRYPPDPAAPNGTWQICRTGKSELIPEISDELLAASVRDPTYLDIIRQLGLRSYIGVPLSVRGKTLGVLAFISAESGRVYCDSDVVLAEDIGRRAAVAIENSVLYRTVKEADQRKDDFLAMLAHELRNPLAPIKAAADLITMPLGVEQLRKTGTIISRQVTHMTALVDDLLDVSRVTRGHVVLDRKIVDIKQATNAAIEQVRPLIECHAHQLTVTVGQGGMFVEGDEKRLVQVISNLLSNAAKYTPSRGQIRLHVDQDGGNVFIRVSDNGIGMSQDLLMSAFKLFVQGKRTADRSQGGLGLGLALVKSMIELHGGTVQAYSKGIDCGSEFVIRLPAMTIPFDVAVKPSDENIFVKSNVQLRILVVDDNVDAALMLAVLIETVGHCVDVEHNPFGALEKFSAIAYDIVIVDIGLPDMDGYELARRLRAQQNGRRIVLIGVSGYGLERDRQEALAAGIDHYFVKPVATVELFKSIAEATRTCCSQ